MASFRSSSSSRLVRKSFQFESDSVFRPIKLSKRFLSGHDLERLIVEHTVINRSNLVPEISLRLITPATKLWTAASDAAPNPFPSDPFW